MKFWWNFSEIFTKIALLETQLLEEIDALVNLQKEINDLIAHSPDNTSRTLLEMKYINLSSFDDIAENLGYDVRHLQRIQKKAFAFLDEYLLLNK